MSQPRLQEDFAPDKAEKNRARAESQTPKPMKRSACDRCHSQKLSCLRQDGDQDSCKCCRRAGATCVFSPSLRTSRGKLAAKGGAAQARGQNRANTHQRVPTSPTEDERSRESSPVSPIPNDAATLLEDREQTLHDDELAMPGITDWPTWMGSSPNFDLSAAVFEMPDLRSQQHSESADWQSFIAPIAMDHDRVTSPLAPHSHDDIEDTAGINHQSTSPSCAAGCVHRLSKLHISLYEQSQIVSSGQKFAESVASSTPIASSSAMPSRPRALSCNATEDNVTTNSELVLIVSSTQQLIETLQCLRSSSDNAMDSSPNGDASTIPPPGTGSAGGINHKSRASSVTTFFPSFREDSSGSINTSSDNGQQRQPDSATVLLALSCYMRLLHVYTQLVKQLHQRLRSGLSVYLPPSLFYIGSIPLPFASNLQAVCLLQLLAHLLDSGSKSVRDLTYGDMEGVLGAREVQNAEWDLRDRLRRCKAELKDSSVL